MYYRLATLGWIIVGCVELFLMAILVPVKDYVFDPLFRKKKSR
ncbi:MAG TPA: hypothetical protein VLA04_04660 [Verrucomicrobiae bacterium]|nr:hypothetical protein [Verrucomicrobiae bacterium]